MKCKKCGEPMKFVSNYVLLNKYTYNVYKCTCGEEAIVNKKCENLDEFFQ